MVFESTSVELRENNEIDYTFAFWVTVDRESSPLNALLFRQASGSAPNPFM
jgi:hypothetical protein